MAPNIEYLSSSHYYSELNSSSFVLDNEKLSMIVKDKSESVVNRVLGKEAIILTATSIGDPFSNIWMN